MWLKVGLLALKICQCQTLILDNLVSMERHFMVHKVNWGTPVDPWLYRIFIALYYEIMELKGFKMDG